MLTRVLEPEVMDTPEEAQAYDAMDHSEVNRLFVSDFLRAGPISGETLDLGTGTALIPIELCRRAPHARVRAIDLAENMLDLARANLVLANLTDRVTLQKVDAKGLPFADGRFGNVMSNSIVHHIPDPAGVLSEAVRVTARGGLLFFRDLLRPESEGRVDELVAAYAGSATDHQRSLFRASLCAALSLDEMGELVERLGFARAGVEKSSDRHWTWAARR
jgi:ubiquinone/menaquinone biosynthesis C-methylase UbiE